jgi:hypothetical protein
MGRPLTTDIMANCRVIGNMAFLSVVNKKESARGEEEVMHGFTDGGLGFAMQPGYSPYLMRRRYMYKYLTIAFGSRQVTCSGGGWKISGVHACCTANLSKTPGALG